MTLKNQDIICFAGEDWWFHNPHSNLHIMESFAKDNRVLFVNSTGIRMPDFKSDKFFWKRVGNKLKSLMRYLKKADKNIYVFTPFAFPLVERFESVISRINKALMIVQMNMVLACLKFKRPILWVTVPVARDIVLYLKKNAKCLVYYCVDNVSHFPGVNYEFMSKLEQDIQANADLSLFVNKTLVEERGKYNKNIHWIGHGVDYAHFAKSQQKPPEVPEDIKNIPQPIVGYVGEIKPLDFDLVRFLAKNNPNMSFVFIGDIYHELSQTQFPTNVYFLGKKPYAQLPSYMSLFSCCCLYYNPSDVFNNYRNPKKLMEYLTTGKPIVSVDILQIREFSQVVNIAKDYEDFNRLLMEAVHNDTDDLRQKRTALARQNTWDSVAEQSGKWIEEIISGR